mgnify:CR=1 FL=1
MSDAAPYVRSLGAKVGNVFGFFFLFSGTLLFFDPEQKFSQLSFFFDALFGLSLMDLHVPWMLRTFSRKNVDRLRVCIPILLFLLSFFLSSIELLGQI